MGNKGALGAALAVGFCAFGVSDRARAAESPPTPPEREKVDKAEQREVAGKPIFEDVHFSTNGTVASSPVLLLGFNIDDALFAVGFGFLYNPNGLPNPVVGMPPLSNKFQANLVLSASYMLYDRRPLAFGPEVDYVTLLAPQSAFQTYNEIDPGIAFWYLPWKAPILLGTAALLPIKMAKGSDPTLESLRPDLRFIWAFM